MKTVLHLTNNEACELLAEALRQRSRIEGRERRYRVVAHVSAGYAGNPLDHCPASVRFEAEEE